MLRLTLFKPPTSAIFTSFQRYINVFGGYKTKLFDNTSVPYMVHLRELPRSGKNKRAEAMMPIDNYSMQENFEMDNARHQNKQKEESKLAAGHLSNLQGAVTKTDADLSFFYGEEMGLLQGKRRETDHIIEVDTSAGEPVYTPSVQLLIDISSMKPNEVCKYTANLILYILPFCLNIFLFFTNLLYSVVVASVYKDDKFSLYSFTSFHSSITVVYSFLTCFRFFHVLLMSITE